MRPKKSAQAAPGFTRQAVGIRLAGGSLDHRRRAGRRELTTIPERAELQRLRDELTATAPAGDPPGPQVYTTIWPPQLKRAVTFYAGQMLNKSLSRPKVSSKKPFECFSKPGRRTLTSMA